MSPQRIQRTEDWKPSKSEVWVGPRSKFYNPFAAKIKTGTVRVHTGESGLSTMSRENLVDDFKRWLTIETTVRRGVEVFFNGSDSHLGVKYAARNIILENLGSLRGKDLVCRCHFGQPCHGDVLLELANGSAL